VSSGGQETIEIRDGVLQAAGRVDLEPGVPQNLVVEAVAAVGRVQPGGTHSLVVRAAVAVGKTQPGDTQRPEA
jgi:hypothetical protein